MSELEAEMAEMDLCNDVGLNAEKGKRLPYRYCFCGGPGKKRDARPTP